MKRNYLLVLLIAALVTANAIAQPVVKTQKVIGGNSTDLFTCMDITTDGGLIVGGTSYSGISGQKTDSVRGGMGSDYWIVKLDNKGKVEWDKTIGGDGEDDLKSVRQTSDGGYILGGRSTSGISGEKTVDGKAWAVKSDQEGNVQWDKTFTATDDFSVIGIEAIELTKDGGYIINVPVSFEDYNSPVWVIKTDSFGNMEWENFAPGEIIFGKGSCVIQTRDEGYLVGYSDYNHSSEGFMYKAARLDKYGNTKWVKYYNLDHFPYTGTTSVLRASLETPDGNFILAGYSDAFAGPYKSEDSKDQGYMDYWLLRIDSLGNYVSDKTIGGASNDYLMDAIRTKDKGIILGGYSYSDASYEKSENRKGSTYNADYWVVKLDRMGNIEWDKTIGGDTADILVSIREPKRNQFILGGYSWSGISGDKTIPSRGDADYWLVGLQNIPAIKQQGTQKAASAKVINPGSFTVYPNPVKDILHIQTNTKATVTLNDQSGKTIFTKTINGKEDININRLPAGLYYLKNDETGEVQKVMITK